ncbi:MAG: YIP1 family protein, partial [Pseudomonadota bacterium]
MPVTRDIVQSYTRPRKVMRRLLDAGQREDRA